MCLRIWTNWRKIFCLRIWTNTYRGLMEPQKFTSVIYNNCFSELRTMSKSTLWPSETLCDQWGQCLFGQDHWENETWGLVWSWILIFKPTAKWYFICFICCVWSFLSSAKTLFFFHFSLVIPFSIFFFFLIFLSYYFSVKTQSNLVSNKKWIDCMSYTSLSQFHSIKALQLLVGKY